jgi:hypothetical protein
VWISYADTGYGGATLAPFAQNNTLPVMTVTESFWAGTGSQLTVKAWADDTAIVSLWRGSWSTVLIGHGSWSNNVCEDVLISCTPTGAGTVDYTFLADGDYELRFDTYQIGTALDTYSNPFGLLYEGELTVVPEPGSLSLLGLGLASMARAVRRRRK